MLLKKGMDPTGAAIFGLRLFTGESTAKSSSPDWNNLAKLSSILDGIKALPTSSLAEPSHLCGFVIFHEIGVGE